MVRQHNKYMVSNLTGFIYAFHQFFDCDLIISVSDSYPITLNPNKYFTNYHLSLLDDCLTTFFEGKIKSIISSLISPQYMYLHDNYSLFTC